MLVSAKAAACGGLHKSAQAPRVNKSVNFQSRTARSLPTGTLLPCSIFSSAICQSNSIRQAIRLIYPVLLLSSSHGQLMSIQEAAADVVPVVGQVSSKKKSGGRKRKRAEADDDGTETRKRRRKEGPGEQQESVSAPAVAAAAAATATAGADADAGASSEAARNDEPERKSRKTSSSRKPRPEVKREDHAAASDAEQEDGNRGDKKRNGSKKRKSKKGSKSDKRSKRHVRESDAADDDADQEDPFADDVNHVDNIADEEERSKYQDLATLVRQKKRYQEKSKPVIQDIKEWNQMQLEWVLKNADPDDKKRCQEAAYVLAKAMAKAADERKEKKLAAEKERLADIAAGGSGEVKKKARAKGAARKKPRVTAEMKDACILRRVKLPHIGWEVFVRARVKPPHRLNDEYVSDFLIEKLIVQHFRVTKEKHCLDIARALFSAEGRVNDETFFKVEHKKLIVPKTGKAGGKQGRKASGDADDDENDDGGGDDDD